MKESSIEKAVCDYARKYGAIVMKLSGPNQKGQPDRMFLKNGKVVFIEFKAPGKKPTALQERWIKQLIEQGFYADWCDDVENGTCILEDTIL